MATESSQRMPLRDPRPRSLVAVTWLLALAASGCLFALVVQHRTAPLDARSAVLRIDPNRASAAELELLPHIGPKIAATIIEFREHSAQSPAFRKLDDLDAIRGIGPATLEAIGPYLDFAPPE